MEEWISALKMASNKEFYQEGQTSHSEVMSGQHNWYACSHARPTFCNVCKETLPGVTSHGLSCEVCKFKAHKRCAVRAPTNCKWTSLSSIGKDIIEDEDGIWMPHQWMEGNLPVSAKCSVCDKTCGSVLRLQDWRCLWCRAMVHAGCLDQMAAQCPLGQCRLSILPPTSITSIDSDGYWEGTRPAGTSPLLVYVNTKSGDNQGVKFLRRFKQLLNPAQVFDLMNGGPYPGLKLFQRFDSFRILICGGDGSIGWVLAEIDRMDLHRQCQVGVLPFGTGNDLARVLGWGSTFDDDTQLPGALERLEHAQIKMLDRWSIWTYEGTMPPPRKLSMQNDAMSQYEDSMANHLTKILHSEDHQAVISSARVLCETVKAFVDKVSKWHPLGVEEGGGGGGEKGEASGGDAIGVKFDVLNEKLQSLLTTLHRESQSEESQSQEVTVDVEAKDTGKEEEGDPVEEAEEASSVVKMEPSMTTQDNPSPSLPVVNNEPIPPQLQMKPKPVFKSKEALMSRANSLKKAVRQIIEHAEKAVDEQNAQTLSMTQGSSLVPGVQGSEVPTFHTQMLKLKSTEGSRSAPSFSVFSQEPSPLAATPKTTASTTATPSHLSATTTTTATSNATTTTTTTSMSANTAIAKCIQQDTDTPVSLRVPVGSRSPLLSPSSRRISSMSTFNRSSSLDSKLSLASKSSTELDTIHQQDQQQQQLDHQQLQQQQQHLHLQQQQQQQQLPLPFTRSPFLHNAIHLPGVSSSIAKSLSGGGFISKVLLANADALCAAASPLLEQDIPLDSYQEKCVMNNYFGIGLDAKVTLEFQNKREEHPEKCRSRTKNMMWYGVLGSKEIFHKTFKNLDQRVLLECDGQRIPLPSLQGIVILNIPSYCGGANFWGGSKQDENFSAPSFDDRILEVVAVFGGMQIAVSKFIDLQHHRIAQCRSVKVTILGDEGVPVQVDGEAWIQPPGYVRIVHKNRAQMLIRDRTFESVLKSWSEKQKLDRPASPQMLALTEEEMQTLINFIEATSSVLRSVKVASKSHTSIEEELIPIAQRVSECVDRLHPIGKLAEPIPKSHVEELVQTVRIMYHEASYFLTEKAANVFLSTSMEDRLTSSLISLHHEMKRVLEILGPIHLEPMEEINLMEHQKRKQGKLFKQMYSKLKGRAKEKGRSNLPPVFEIRSWTLEEVGQWLESLSLTQYKESFKTHEIRGAELLNLERRDLKDLGVTKVGHLKRLQQAIKELQHREAAYDRPCS